MPMVRGRLKRNIYNPLVTLVSTDIKRLTHKPAVKISNKRFPVSIIEWLKNLESPYTYASRLKAEKEGDKYLRSKSETESKHDLDTLAKFWRIATERRYLRELLKNSDLDNAEIARQLGARLKRKVNQEEIRLVREAWGLKSQSEKQSERAAKVVAFAQSNPNITFENIGKEVGLSGSYASALVKAAGVKKPNAHLVSPEERAAREDFLRSVGIEFFYKIYTPLAKMKARALHLLKKHKYVVRHYQPFLNMTSRRVDAAIKVLDEFHVDWRDDEKDLWKLIGNKPNDIRYRLKFFEYIGASSELHPFLFKNFRKPLLVFNSEGYKDLRRAVVSRDIVALNNFAKRVCVKFLNRDARSHALEYYDAAKTAFVSVLKGCKHPEKHPAAFLALVSFAIGVALDKEALRFARTTSADTFTDLPSGHEIKPKRKKRT